MACRQAAKRPIPGRECGSRATKLQITRATTTFSFFRSLARAHRICGLPGANRPASGRFAQVSFWIEQLPPDCDLNDLKIAFDGAPGTPCYIGPPEWGVLNQVRVLLPRGIRTG